MSRKSRWSRWSRRNAHPATRYVTTAAPAPLPESLSTGDLQQATGQLTGNDAVRQAFNPAMLTRTCLLPEEAFAAAFDLKRVDVEQRAPSDFYLFRDNGARVLAVAHLDTVVRADERAVRYSDSARGPVIHSGSLDDRLGAYIILDLLPKLGVSCDWLLTTGEEQCRTTAAFFQTEKRYDHVIEFDRGGTDVVMYDYEDAGTCDAVEASGAQVGFGSFSDICRLEQLGVKAFNWGTGYRDYHSVRGHALLTDTFDMVTRYLRFHAQNAGIVMPHVPAVKKYRSYSSRLPRYPGQPAASSSRSGYHSSMTWDEYLNGRPGDPWMHGCPYCKAKRSVDPDTRTCEYCLSCYDCGEENENGGTCTCRSTTHDRWNSVPGPWTLPLTAPLAIEAGTKKALRLNLLT